MVLGPHLPHVVLLDVNLPALCSWYRSSACQESGGDSWEQGPSCQGDGSVLEGPWISINSSAACGNCG